MQTNNKQLITWLNSLGIEPKKLSYYLEALTHKSYKNENKLNYDYDKLEFLGDSIIGYLVTDYLFNTLKLDSVGKLTEAKILLVQSDTLAEAAKDINLSKVLKLGVGMKNIDSNKILEDAFESFIGAIYLDLGIQEAKKILEYTIFKYYSNHKLDRLTDYKSLIQVALVKHSKKETLYKIKQISPFVFEAQLIADDILYGVGYGKNKKLAEKEAAKDAYSRLITKNIKEKDNVIFKKI